MRTKYLLIIFFLIALIGVVSLKLFKRDPARIIETVYGIKLDDFDYTKKYFREQWYPNGDGESTIILKLNKFTKENDAYLNTRADKLPISGNLFPPGESPPRRNGDRGYYIYCESKSDSRNYSFLMVDLDKMEIFSYIHEY